MKYFIMLIFVFTLLIVSCSTLKKQNGIELLAESGEIITEFTDDSPLAKAGIRKKDILWEYDGTIIQSVQHLSELKELVKYVDKEGLYNKIKSSIDEGMPLIAIDLTQTHECGIITGYQKDGKELICRTYFDQNKDYEIAPKVPWAIVRIINKKKVDVAPLYLESLKLA